MAAGDGSTAAQVGNALALISLRRRIFGGSDADQKVVLQLDLAEGTLDPVQLADIDAVIDVLESSRAGTLAQIETFSLSFAAVEPEELVIGDGRVFCQVAGEVGLATGTAEVQLRTFVADGEFGDGGFAGEEAGDANQRDLLWGCWDVCCGRG